VLKKSIWYSFAPSALWFLIIVVGSLLPSSKVPDIDVSDKWIHFVFYAIFAFLLFLSALGYTKRINSRVARWRVVLIIGTVVGLGIELIQHDLIYGRQGEWTDVLANTIGLLGALFIAELLKNKGVFVIPG
jgi:VanZ family protein